MGIDGLKIATRNDAVKGAKVVILLHSPRRSTESGCRATASSTRLRAEKAGASVSTLRKFQRGRLGCIRCDAGVESNIPFAPPEERFRGT
jgi:hypothetical protein